MTDKGDGVFVDFSDVDEEVVEEEVVQSGATSANAVPGSQGPLPPVVYEYVEKFKESYSQYRKQYLVGLAVLGIVVLVAIVAAFLFLGGDAGGSSDSYNAKQTSFVVGPITVPHDERYEGVIPNIPRPPGDIAIHRVDMSVVDKNNQTIPLYTIYNHHMLITNQKGYAVAVVGAESAGIPGVHLPLPYVVHAEEKDTWSLNAELLNLWGPASGADFDVYVLYEVTFSDFDSDTDINVGWGMVGEGSGHVDVSPSCENYEDKTCKFVYEENWSYEDATLVDVIGHLHIGAINITLDDLTRDQTIAVAVPVYDDENSYVVSMDTTFEQYEITQGTKLRVTSYYDAQFEYGGVMSLFQIWGTFDPFPVYSSQVSASESSESSSMTSSSYYSSSFDSISGFSAGEGISSGYESTVVDEEN